MKIAERILVVLILLAIILKLNFMPGGTIIYTLSLIVLSILYYPLGFAFFNQINLRNIFKKDSYKGINAQRIIIAIFIGISLSTICMGISFKLNHWPGAKNILLIGLVTTFLMLIISVIFYLKSKHTFYIFVFKRIAILGIVGLALFLSSDLILEKIQYRNHPECLKAYEEYLKNPQDDVLWEKLQRENFKARHTKEEYDMFYSDSTNYN